MFNVIETQNVPVKAWTNGVPVEDSARQQLINVASLPFIHKHVAIMPDVHWGMGATVGSLIPTVGAIIPAAVGVDIGCGMAAVRTNIPASELPDNLGALRAAIEAAVPHGRTDHGRRNDTGAWTGDPPDEVLASRPEGTGHFGAYVRAVGWAQRYARLNRELMMAAVLDVLRHSFPHLGADQTAVNCHHNYVAKERHFGKDVWLTRKG